MIPKKLCSLGVLDINLNLVLRKSLADKYNFNINNYDTVEDLQTLFYKETQSKCNNYYYYNDSHDQIKEKINYLDYISLSSNNNLINTLLFINRAYKTKTFIEFIMLNQMEFSESTKFIRKMLQEIFDKNYFFIIENKVLDIPSKIKFIIKILNDNDDEIISMKSFELFEMNEIEFEQNKINIKDEDSENNSFYKNSIHILDIDKINYNFINTNYFLLDMSIIKDFKFVNENDFSCFIYEIIKRYPKINIILIADNFINNIEKNKLKFNKQLIELSDIIFASRNKLNNFFKMYNLTLKNKTKNNNEKDSNSNHLNNNIELIGNQNSKKYDLITEEQEKCRKNISRLTVLLEDFNNITIYKQEGIQMKINYVEIFPLTTMNTKNVNKIKYLLSSSEKFYHIFIAGFLSRLIHDKSPRVCVGAGDLLIKKSMLLFKNNIDYINDIDQFNVLVPSLKISRKRKKNNKIIKEYEELASKENKFVLDCTNASKSKIREYNPLLDLNCASYLLKYQNMKHLKHIGFINKNGIVLNDPDSIKRKKNNSNTINNIIKNKILTDSNFFLRNNKIPFSKTSNNTININNDSPDIKHSPKFKRIFNPIIDKNINNKIGLLSPKLNIKSIFTKKFSKSKNECHFPKMSKTYYNYSNQESKLSDNNSFNNNGINLRKSKSMYSRNIYSLMKSKRNQSLNNYKKNDNKLLIEMLKNNQKKSNYFPKIIKKIFN